MGETYVNKGWNIDEKTVRLVAGGEFPCGSKILVFIRLVSVLVTFDKNACYAFQTRPGSDRKAVQGIVREKITRILPLAAPSSGICA